MIDSHTVVRLKDGLDAIPRPDPFHFGTRTDYLCARSRLPERGKCPFWVFDHPHWVTYYRKFSHKKPSTGLCAIFCAIENLNPRELLLIGYDRVLTDDHKHMKWSAPKQYQVWGHDQKAEGECVRSLGLTIIDLVSNAKIR